MSFDVGIENEIEVLQAIGTANVNLTGSLDDNAIIGNDSINVIDGSYKDTLTGGGGADGFLWKSVGEIGWFNFDPDIVTDYSSAQGDVLHFTFIDANDTLAGNQDFTFISTAAFTAPGQINWFTNGTDTFIQLNTNADLTVDGIIQLNGVTNGDAVLMLLVTRPADGVEPRGARHAIRPLPSRRQSRVFAQRNRASDRIAFSRGIALRIAIRRCWQNQSAKRCIASPGRHSLRNGSQRV